MNDFMSRKGLEKLTKRKKREAQKKCLRKNEIDFFEDADGNPIVPVPIRRITQAEVPVARPRFELLRKAS